MLGGSFDPIHNGHLELAAAVLRESAVEEIRLLPAWKPPHKGGSITPAIHRVAMCQLAVQRDSRLKADTIEVDRQISYTADTLRYLSTDNPDVQWSLVVGEDILRSLPYWKDSDSILRMADLIISRRAGQNANEDFDKLVQYLQQRGGRITVLRTVPDRISSSQIRRLAAEGKSLSGLVPKEVVDYIAESGLYREE